jgi:hypothetical protein
MNTQPTPEPTNRNPETRLARLAGWLEMMAQEERKSSEHPGDALDIIADDLDALRAVLEAAARDLPAASNVPEWHNFEDDDNPGNLYRLGSVAHCYAAWIEEGEGEVSEHDGATQLAALAHTLTDTLNALDRLAWDDQGEEI